MAGASAGSTRLAATARFAGRPRTGFFLHHARLGVVGVRLRRLCRLAALRRPGSALVARAVHGRRAVDAVAIHIGAGLFFAAHFQEAARLRFVQQIAEGAKAVVRLVEIRLAALQRIFQCRCPDLAAVAALGHQRLEGLDHHVHGLGLARFQFFLAAAFFVRRATLAGAGSGATTVVAAGVGGALAFARQVVIEDEFVAVGNQQVRRGLLHAHADHLLVVLAQLGHQRRKVGIAADDHEGIDVRLGIAEVQRVHDQPDVGGILARLAHVRNFDQLEIGLVHGGLEFLVAFPVAIGFLDDDAALEQQAFQHGPDVELLVFGVPHTQRHVLEVAEKRHADVFVGGSHILLQSEAATCFGPPDSAHDIHIRLCPRLPFPSAAHLPPCGGLTRPGFRRYRPDPDDLPKPALTGPFAPLSGGLTWARAG